MPAYFFGLKNIGLTHISLINQTMSLGVLGKKFSIG
jgi:Na+/pantothenate symporter